MRLDIHHTSLRQALRLSKDERKVVSTIKYQLDRASATVAPAGFFQTSLWCCSPKLAIAPPRSSRARPGGDHGLHQPIHRDENQSN